MLRKKKGTIMNTYMKLIIEVLGCDEAKAREVFDELCCMDIRFSESSTKKLTRFIKEANEQLAMKAA